MELFLMRHGAAEDTLPDEARKLTDEGIQKSKKAAKFLRRNNETIACLVHSRLQRSIETADILSEFFPEAERIEQALLSPYNGVDRLLPWLQEMSTRFPSLLVVGHEPQLASLATQILAEKNAPILQFKKSGIVAIDYALEHKSLMRYFVSPKFY